MANEEQVALLKKTVNKWNHWRQKNPGIRPDLSGANLCSVNLSGANLSNANLSDAKLLKTNLSGVNLSGASLIRANFSNSTLIQPRIFESFGTSGNQGANLSHANLSGADLRGANLRQTDFSEANLSDANLSDADLYKCSLHKANLSRAELVRTQVLETNFSQAILTGAFLRDLKINNDTNLAGVICDYIYLQEHQQERCPENRNFLPGEFSAFFQKAFKTGDLTFSTQYPVEDEAKYTEIANYHQHVTDLIEILKTQSNRPINVEAKAIVENQIMSGDRYINTSGGNYIESNTGTYVQGNYLNMGSDLSSAAVQIQDLIEQLQKRGMTVEVAQEQVAKDMATQAQTNSTVKTKLLKWGQSLGDATVSDVVKGVVKLAIRSAGIPLP
jgi:uncharacterized protein YjbI with pentapeptide repeats